MTAIQERSGVDLALVKKHLRLDPDDTSEDDLLQVLLDGAKSAADAYCSNPFVDADGEDEQIPGFVETWILQKVASFYEYREGVLVSKSIAGIGSVSLTKDDRDDLHPGWKVRI